MIGVLFLALSVQTSEWKARPIFETSASEGLRLSPDGASIELDSGELFEDDGPAAGRSYKPQDEEISGDVRIRKELLIPNPKARKATLLVAPGGNLQAVINGTPQPLEKRGVEGKYWQAYGFDPAALVPGRNEIVLHGSGKVWIARDDEFAAGSRTRPRHPDRSARSDDGGRTWRNDRLGTTRDVDGEYAVRVYLDHHRPEGWMVLPVFDLGNPEGKPVGPPAKGPGPVRVTLPGAVGSILLSARSGPGPVMGGADWQDLPGGVLERPAGRYLQIKVRLFTTDPLTSPSLKALRVEGGTSTDGDWTKSLIVLERGDVEIVRSSVPFRYEPFDRPELKALRETAALDRVVQGARGEFEVIERLAAWASARWERGHLGEVYPAWNALEILKPHRDGTPVGGFCQQYNVVFLQACESFGLVGRAVSISQGGLGEAIKGSGHEVVEIWSNDHGKWVYVDGNAAWYAVDAEGGSPLSLWELRERQLAALDGRPHRPIRVVTLAPSRYAWDGLTAWPPFGELRIIPRSNFLEERAPLPLNQGMRGWFWTGHYVWTDDRLPAALLYGNRVRRRGNFEWTLNQARILLEARPSAGELRVFLETETPGFTEFLGEIDGSGRKPVASGFVWTLHKGRNRLEVRARNAAGREGRPSRFVIEAP